jgi:hypothetical protein
VIICRSVLRTAGTALTLGILCAARVAAANPASIVPSAADPGNPADFHVRIDYDYESDQSTISRESVGDPVDPLAPLPKHKELVWHQIQHTLTPRADLGFYHDSWLSFAMPIVITQSRELELANGVDRAGSSTIADGILPAQGFDAQDPGTAPPGNLVFRGVNRSGLDQVHLGLNVAPMNQHKDPTKPTWKLGGEVLLSIGKIAKFDPMNTSGETGISKGVHELRVWTSVDRRFDRVEGWFELWWQTPIAKKKDSLFGDPGFGSTNTELGMQAGTSFGLEVYAVDDKVNNNHVSLDLGTRLTAHFEGRDYSELWEVFALAGDSRGMGPLILDADPTTMGVQALSHPGITNIENYLELAGRVALRAQLGEHVRFAALFDIVRRTDHVITFADAGVDLPTCAAGISSNCEDDPNDLVNPGTREVNPLHVQRIDLVGHRYHSEENFGFVIGIQGQILY